MANTSVFKNKRKFVDIQAQDEGHKSLIFMDTEC